MAFDGFVKIENEWIPYSCKDEKITIYFGMKSITLPDRLDMLVAQSLGLSPSVCSMFKLTIPLCNDGTMKIDGTEKPVTMFDHICIYTAVMCKHGCAAQICYLSVVSSRQQRYPLAKAYVSFMSSLNEGKT